MVVVLVFWLLASPLTIRHPRAVQKGGQAVVGWLKGLLERTNPTATYAEADISEYFWTNGEKPETAEYERLKAGAWSEYRLRVDGLVETPLALSYDELRAMPKQEQITQHFCIQGWSGIAKWGGVSMRAICEAAGPTAEAKWVVFYS
ncbi:MAG: molybdopterin-dependent oxidoreductase, partial [Mycobacterium sp.]|nr:molybdopterin-dependent oxidoreductase [Mycobacterium sp.]